MKRLAVLTLALVSTFANAETVKILDVTLDTPSYSSSTASFARFYMNQTTGEGFAKISTTNTPASSDDFPTTILNKTVKIENLMLMGDQMMFHGAEGNVDCGKMTVSRVFKKPTILLTGKCFLQTKTVGNNLQVFFVTK